MKLFQNIWKKTLTYKTYNMVQSIIEYNKSLSYINDTLYSEEFKLVLKKYLGINVKEDWLGRLYGIINPNIDINGYMDISNTIIEIDGDNTNSSEYVKTWLYKQFDLIQNLFQIKRLYDYISVEISHVGPINQDNYLLVIDVVDRKLMTEAMKSFLKHSILYMFIGTVLYGLFHFGII